MKMIWLLPLLFFVLGLGATLGFAQPRAGLDPATAKVVQGNNTFALELYRELSGREGNLFFSPYSISDALAMTYAGAQGETEKQMKQTLHFDLPEAKFHAAFSDLIARLQFSKDRKFDLRVANRLWGQKDYGFLPDFLQLTKRDYHAGLEEVDFARATEEARQRINKWVEEQTSGKIQDLIQEGVLNDMTRLVLTNAIYFKAAWLRPFDEKNTEDGPFLTAGGKVAVPMMHFGGMRTRFYQGDGVRMLELPYEGGEASMLVLLPEDGEGLPELEKRLTIANLNNWFARLSTHLVDVALPKFQFTAEFRLDDALKDMGMPIAFDRNRADFSGMATREQLFISAVVHKAFVDVNEAGTEAAAATAVVIEARSLPPRADFVADRPFVFAIRDNNTGSLLFLGRVANPKA